MHVATTVTLGCTDCHGGNATVSPPPNASVGSDAFTDAQQRAHPQPRLDIWTSSANPVRPASQTLQESREFIKFVNPGDLRVVGMTCGLSGCHAEQTDNVWTSMMTHGGMLWGAALYNNGAVPFKSIRYGEFYTPDGQPASVFADPAAVASPDRPGGDPSVAPAAAEMGNLAAGQHSADLRARRASAGRNRDSGPVRGTGPAREAVQ